MQNRSSTRTPRRLEVQFQDLLEVWVMLVRVVEVCGDNENVLVSGMEFYKQVRARQGFTTTVTTNRNYSKDRTNICERTTQTVRNLQKTLLMQLEESIKCKIPQGHAVLYGSLMFFTWHLCIPLGSTIGTILTAPQRSHRIKLRTDDHTTTESLVLVRWHMALIRRDPSTGPHGREVYG